MSTRPKPRPRPRPRPAVAGAIPSSPGPSNSTPLPTKLTSVEDEDALFMRNRSRDAQAWKQLRKISDETEKSVVPTDHSSDDDEHNSPRRKQKRKAKETVPDWIKNPKQAMEQLSDEDDDEVVILDHVKIKTNNAKRDNDATPRRANKRARSRSRSITPPPDVPLYALQNARDTVRQMLAPEAPRAPSPTWIEETSTDTIILDPELASIARRVQSRASQPRVQSGVAPAASEGGGPENVMIKVRWKPHPLNPAGKSSVYAFKVKRYDALRELFEETADMAGVVSENMIVTYDNGRVYPSATSHSLGIWAEAELEACDKTTYTYIRETPKRPRSPSVELVMDARSRSRAHSPTPAPEESEAESVADSASEDDKFKLTLRSGKTKDIVLTVRPTTTCGAVVKAFLKKAGLSEQYASATTQAAKGKRGKKAQVPPASPGLMLDGDKLDPQSTLGDADLEDGDMVEVFGL